MGRKSHVVPLGVLLKNENKGDEMKDILEHLQQYVPSASFRKTIGYGSGRTLEITDNTFRKVLLGGDQLTASRIRGAQLSRQNSLSAASRLEGLVATAADFHVKLNLLDVGWKYFYSTSSAGEMGTMYQLRNLIGRKNVNADPIHKYNECDDFFKLVVACHIVAAAMKELKMQDMSDVPTFSGISDEDTIDLWMEDEEQRKTLLKCVSDEIVDKYISFQYHAKLQSSKDKILDYGRRLLEFGMFYLEYSDAIREGDGERLSRCWRYLLLITKSADRRNYGFEVLNMLCQYHFDLPPRQAQELLWSRFVCSIDSTGHNVAEDLHQEHLNRVVKDAIRGLGANKTEKAITRAGKALGTLEPVLRQFDAENGLQRPYGFGSHVSPSDAKDAGVIVDQLVKTDIFSEKLEPRPRCHTTFKKPKDFLHNLGKPFFDWLHDHL